MIELINFTQLSHDEKLMVLEWRNHLSVRKFMFGHEPIALENHLAYIKTLYEKEDRLYFLVKKDSEPIGVIDFTDIDHENSRVYIGLYAKPLLRGMGDILMETTLEYAFNTLAVRSVTCEVFEENHSAVKLYKRFNFKEHIKRNNIIVMELKNENR